MRGRWLFSNPVTYFDPNKQTKLVTVASPSGLSAILMQNTPDMKDRRVVVYASRALTDVERQYSQTEREALAVVWAIEKLHLYYMYLEAISSF